MRGFTLIEVVLALLVLQLGVLGVLGTLVLASSTLRKADELEHAVAEAEGVLDSLATAPVGGVGWRSMPWGEIRWLRDSGGKVEITAIRAPSDTFVRLESMVRD